MNGCGRGTCDRTAERLVVTPDGPAPMCTICAWYIRETCAAEHLPPIGDVVALDQSDELIGRLLRVLAR